jgi:hypothetical protein
VTALSHRQRANGDDRTRTGDLSPDKRLLLPLSYAPEQLGSAGGIRTHGLELMRLAGKRAALVREADQWRGSGGSAQRSYAKRTGGGGLGEPGGSPSANHSQPGGSPSAKQPQPRKSGRLESNQRSPAPKAGGVATLPYGQKMKVGGGPCFPQPGRRVAQNASRCHPLLVGTPASHRRGPPGRCPLPLATPDARYGPRTA